ncbi:MAG: hypothetical protein QXU82_00545 [Candidatus Aenigmatarchaeota archaeon]
MFNEKEKKEEPEEEPDVAPWDDGPQKSAAPPASAEPVKAEERPMPSEPPNTEEKRDGSSVYAAFMPKRHKTAYCKWWSKSRLLEIYPGRCENMNCDIFIIEMAGSDGKYPKKAREAFPYCCEYCTTDINEAVKALQEYRKSQEKVSDVFIDM